MIACPQLPRISFILIFAYSAFGPFLNGSTEPMKHIPAEVDFGKVYQTWDGFGFNYVETCQSRDYEAWPQEYGGFSLLDESEKAEIIEAVFGESGLQVEIVKMFLDPWHQEEPGGAFDHERTTSNMLEFVEAGVALSREHGRNIEVITTLYGPPPWATHQGFIGGRDLDPAMMPALADYMINWALFLRGRGINVKYLSIHNEGEDFYRWDYDDGTQRLEHFDYNAYWRPEEINAFILILADRISELGIPDLGVTNGEPSNWTRFYNWGYAHPLADNPEVMQRLGLLTTHGFINGDYSRLSYSSIDGRTTRLLREKKPDLRAWVTSYSWGKMDTIFAKVSHHHIYRAGVNALIPWAGIQNPSQWLDGDPNPGNAITVHDDGSYELTTGYFLYKQLTQAGKRGMKVAHAMLANPVANLIAFSGEPAALPDTFVVIENIFLWERPLKVVVRNSRHTRFRAFRTTQDGEERYVEVGVFEVEDGAIVYDAPFGSITTFIGLEP